MERREIREHLKKLKQIKRELKRDPKGTPLRKKIESNMKNLKQFREDSGYAAKIKAKKD